MSKDTLGIVLAVIVGVMGFAIWLADKYGKATPMLTVMVLIMMAGLCVCGVYLIPWLWNAKYWAETIWRVSSATLLVLIAVGYFGVWLTRPPHALDASGTAERPPEKKSCHPETAQFDDCTEAEVLEWGKPLLGRLQDAIQKKETSTHARIERFKKDHDEALLKMDKMREDVELNRYLERDYKNFKTYRAAVLWKLKGGNPTDSDPIQALGAAVGGELILSDMDSHLSDAEFILRDLQELGNHLAQQIVQESKVVTPRGEPTISQAGQNNIAQIGNNNQANIDTGRRLSKKDRSRLINALMGLSVKVRFSAMLAAPDASQYAYDLREAFKAAGIEVVDTPFQVTPVAFTGAPWSGTEVAWHGESQGSNVNVSLDSPQGKILEALANAHASPKHAHVGPEEPEGIFTIVVGLKPEGEKD